MSSGAADTPSTPGRGIALALMARRPLRGRVKTRLARTLGPDAALRLYRAMTEDTWELLGQAGLPRYLHAEGDPWLDGAAEVLAQPEGLFGERVDHLLVELGRRGHTGCVVLGADTPHLDPELLAEGIAWVTSAAGSGALVVSPSDDGGLVLLGSSLPQVALLADLAWETDQLIKAFWEWSPDPADVPYKGYLVTRAFDLDDEDDLRRMLACEPHGRAPRTRAVANELLSG